MDKHQNRAKRRSAAVALALLLLTLTLCALPIFGADAPSEPTAERYNHFTTYYVQKLGLFDNWVSAKQGRSVAFDEATGSIFFTLAQNDAGTTITTPYVDVTEMFPFMLAGDSWIYYAGGGTTYGTGFEFVFLTMETSSPAPYPRAYLQTWFNSAQLTNGGAQVAIRVNVPSEAQQTYVVPYVSVYRVNATNTSTFYKISDPFSDSVTTATAQAEYVPFELTPLLDYTRDRGYQAGYNTGRNNGYRDGYEAGEDAGYANGYQAGEDVGYEAGEDAGYASGYADGTREGGRAFYSLAGAVINVPIQGIRGLMNFDILGVNMVAFFGSILTLLALFWLIKLVV